MTAFTIAAAAARAGLPESTLRYWERIGLVEPVPRDDSSGHRRYSEEAVAQLETLANLRAVGMPIEDMRTYLDSIRAGDRAASEQRHLFQAHAERLRGEIEAMQARLSYLELKVGYWSARETGDLDRAEAVAAELMSTIRQINPKEQAS